MRGKGTKILWVITALLMLYSPLFAQIKPADRKTLKQRPPQEKPNYTEEEVIGWIDREISDCQNPGKGCFETGLYQYAEIAVSLKSDKIVQKILDVPESESFNEEYPEYAYDVTKGKVIALRLLKDFLGVREYVIQSVDHQSPKVQIAAASTLLSWGEEWELAAPVICKTEAYIVFRENKDDRAIPLLEEATKNGSWQGRIFAAAALFYSYGDSTKYPQVALDIILNAPINTEDEDINRAKYLALQQVARFNLVEALPGLIRLTQDTARGIAPNAVGYLIDLSGMGYPEATQALADIKEHHSNANIREIARNGLLKLEEEKK